ncbi:HVO_2922 family protein [Haloferax sp. DFSO60]|uniref:HVO_2922 family protein n=1 Tax=Haloferax sp. DFSO60 TaxID=3388652 RepID=UPI003977F452
MSKARFEVYLDAASQYRWRLVHDNGNILADSGEGYASKQKAKQGIQSVKTNASDARIVDL